VALRAEGFELQVDLILALSSISQLAETPFQQEGLLCFRWLPAENDWLARFLLSFGPDAEVLAPPGLCRLVQQMAQQIVDWYRE
jgi:predicted DNA-binding transcriptional regulator YafY